MRVRKSLLFLILFHIVSASLWSESFIDRIIFFTAERPAFSVKQNIQFNLWQDSKERGIGFSTIADFDMKELTGSLGVNFCNGNYDFTTEIIYWPTFFELFNLGFGFRYHLYDYVGVFVENDFLFNSYFKIQPLSWLCLFANCGYFYKLSVLDGFDAPLENKSFNINSGLYFYPDESWTLSLSFLTINYFNCPLFFTLILETGAEFEVLPSRFSTGLDLSAKFYDVFVNSQDLSQFNIRIYGRLKI
ncbi:MAG: hypothetical protein K6C97_03590 [Treponema sp.]|nr:hypothetical protein [Treponema sp.]